jgi:hypothetical protein
VSQARAHSGYTSASSTFGSAHCSRSTALMWSRVGRVELVSPYEGVMPTRHVRGQAPCSGSSFGQPGASSFFEAVSGRSHKETWAGCIVSLTTSTRSSLKASRSVSSLSFAEKASSVFAASYLLR